ncbi:mediator complex, subunit Med18 [Clohesyomyces aquaticus]|uniref:Mediator of RNA polymerase II transcription subunit 18 n=1 Tax=Clohesyomyces aquaticus TaxID=1231657 RepID=A0A1Y1ZPT6_9PLEO|nr:mediator complex, subunit Med18 [Clohesyomyces aquaticus]
MHELLLFGQVPQSRHEQVLKILAGVAAMQPRAVLERHLVYKPQREPEEPGSHLRRGGTQAIAMKTKAPATARDLYFSQLVNSLTRDDFDRDADEQAEAFVATGESAADAKWSYQFHETPDTGDRGVLVRLAHNTELLSGDPHSYMVHLGNQYVSEYYLEGHRFVHDNIIVLLHRVLHESGVRPAPGVSPNTALPSFDSLRPLDPSGGYVLEAKIRVQDLNNPNVLDAGIEELKRLKSQMKGCVELNVPDRLLLDTRVKYKPNLGPSAGARPAVAPR